jgi:hypothetical protein
MHLPVGATGLGASQSGRYVGKMYLTFGHASVALDATTCRERWTHRQSLDASFARCPGGLFVGAVDWCGTRSASSTRIRRSCRRCTITVVGRVRPTKELANRHRCGVRTGAVEVGLAHPARCRCCSPAISTTTFWSWTRRSAKFSIVQHGRQHRRRRGDLRTQFEAICGDDLRHGLSLFWRVGTTGNCRLRPCLGAPRLRRGSGL